MKFMKFMFVTVKVDDKKISKIWKSQIEVFYSFLNISFQEEMITDFS